MARMTEPARIQRDEGWRRYTIVMEEDVIEDGFLKFKVSVDPDSVVFNHWHPGFWLAVVRALVSRLSHSRR